MKQHRGRNQDDVMQQDEGMTRRRRRTNGNGGMSAPGRSTGTRSAGGTRGRTTSRSRKKK